jgi:cold shock CspA family protein
VAAGTAKWSGDGRGFGLIAPDGQSTDLNMHRNAVDDGLRSLREGANVPTTAGSQVKAPARSVENKSWTRSAP